MYLVTLLLKRKLQTNDRHQDVYPVENHVRNLVHSASQSMQNPPKWLCCVLSPIHFQAVNLQATVS